MNDIWRGFQLIIVVIVVSAVAWVVSQVVPQIQTAANLPARIQADNARTLAEIGAAPTFIALQVQATHAAIENEQLLTQAEANAQTIAAQGNADSARMNAETMRTLTVGGLFLAAVLIAGVISVFVFRTRAATAAHQTALQLVSKHGGTLILPSGETVQFTSPTHTSAALTAGAPTELSQASAQPVAIPSHQ